MQKWNQVNLFVLKAFATINEPLSIVEYITETFDFLRGVMPCQVFVDSCRCSKTEIAIPSIIEERYEQVLGIKAASVDSAER